MCRWVRMRLWVSGIRYLRDEADPVVVAPAMFLGRVLRQADPAV